MGVGADGDDKGGFDVEVNQWASRATLDIIGVVALGRELKVLHNADDELARLYEWMFNPSKEWQLWFLTSLVLSRPIAKIVPWKVENEVSERVLKLRKICKELVHDKEAAMKVETVESVDTLAHLSRSNNFSNDELVDQISTFLAAGHETISSAFTWVLYLLAKKPHYQTILRDELRTTLGSSVLTAPDLSNLALTLESLPYLNAICAEILRLLPSDPITIRVAARHTTLGSHPIPAGTRFIIPPWLSNRSPHLWGPQAGEFVPERWIDYEVTPEKGGSGAHGGKFNNHGGAPSNYALLTFLPGPRQRLVTGLCGGGAEGAGGGLGAGV